MNEHLIIGRCEGCKYAKMIGGNPNGWMFVACCHEPYKGKWVREIKDCPKISRSIKNEH